MQLLLCCVLYLFFRYRSIAREFYYLAVRFDYFRTHFRANVHGWNKPLDVYLLWFKEATPMVGPLHKIVPFVFYKCIYICGIPIQEGLGQFYLYLINCHSCVQLYKGLKLYVVVPEFGGRQASHHFSPRATLTLFNSTFRHDPLGGVWLGLFNVTAEMPRLLSKLTERLFL